MANPHVR